MHWKRLNASSPGVYSQRILGENKKLLTSTCIYMNRCHIFRLTIDRNVSVIIRLRTNPLHVSISRKNLRGCYQVGHSWILKVANRHKLATSTDDSISWALGSIVRALM